MWYNIDFKKLILLMLPISLRKVGLIAWLEAMIEPIRQIQYDFVQKRQETLYNLQHNGQVCLLRKVLNDKFDRVYRQIRVLDGNQYQRKYIYTDAELKPKYLRTIFIREDADYEDTGVDFIVQIPQEVYLKYEVEAIIDYYKLASKRYKIELL